MTKHVIVSPARSGDTMDSSSSASAEISCYRPTVHISFQISFIFGRWLDMVEDSPPYLFGRLYV